MSWINARRRRPVAGYAALLLGLVVVALLYGSLTRQGGTAQASAPPASQQDITAGKDLFDANCSSCHGLDAQGTSQAPSLVGAGAAAVYFQMSTGRMPAKEVGAENGRGPVKFTEQQIYEIADYVASLGGGPAIPTAEQVSTDGSEHRSRVKPVPGQLRAVPRLCRRRRRAHLRQVRTAADPVHADADLYGDADRARGDAGVLRRRAQPVRPSATSSPTSPRRRVEPNPGGFSLGRIGPVTEGLVIWLGGLGFLVLIALWITAKRRDPRPTGME